MWQSQIFAIVLRRQRGDAVQCSRRLGQPGVSAEANQQRVQLH
jgi:hypothetical protein